MAKQQCPKGMAKNIVSNAMKKHPKWTAKKISENYPVARSTAFRVMKQIREERELLDESLQKAINAHAEPTREEPRVICLVEMHHPCLEQIWT